MAVEAAQQQMQNDLNALDNKLRELKSAYDQYFLGMERFEPTRLRDEVANLVKKYSGVTIQNTSLKFRYNSLTARYNSFQALWTRTLREIEDGTYHREQFKKKLEVSQSESKSPEA